MPTRSGSRLKAIRIELHAWRGSHYLQMTSDDLESQRNTGHEHLVAQLGRPFEVQRAIEQGVGGATEQKVHLSPADRGRQR